MEKKVDEIAAASGTVVTPSSGAPPDTKPLLPLSFCAQLRARVSEDVSLLRTSSTTAVGPERRIAPSHDLSRERGIAEVDGQPSIAEGNARDPKLSSKPKAPTMSAT
jgi:hypothetical protein